MVVSRRWCQLVEELLHIFDKTRFELDRRQTSSRTDNRDENVSPSDTAFGYLLVNFRSDIDQVTGSFALNPKCEVLNLHGEQSSGHRPECEWQPT